ncbi:hypothetical protein N0B51_09670 [Tsuneonella sp. YG55]|uniref:Uncharacterized protein n=1 Tax=Tsuneonella litorea TaxID=2976475 RepID=A0A9X2W1V1_9SPHN|nr:hypothetical protein [Tsuneonella litorea]MCT2559251.1 hypothetical protein [Tsuneonella litorea]
METRLIIAYGLIALIALAAAWMIHRWRLRARAHRRAMRGHPLD